MFGSGNASWQMFCQHPAGDACDCILSAGYQKTSQRFDEMEFARSACAAAQQGNMEKLQRIINRDSDAIHSDGANGTSGYTPLHYAARGGHLEAVKLLISKGAVIDATTSQGGATSLHRAAGQGHTRIVEALLGAGADACIQDSDGETALHKAVSGGHAEVCKLLLCRCPASAQLRDKHGRTPLERASPDSQLHRIFCDILAGLDRPDTVL